LLLAIRSVLALTCIFFRRVRFGAIRAGIRCMPLEAAYILWAVLFALFLALGVETEPLTNDPT
jgi:hypothetical protein